MVKPLKTGGLEVDTGHAFESWVKFLDAASARDLTHGEIVAKIRTVPEVTGWWAQYVAIAYEQHIGRRLPGQKSDGTFTVTLTRTIAGSPQDTLAAWERLIAAERHLDCRTVENTPARSETRSGLNWRIRFNDGSRLLVNFLEAKHGATKVSCVHERLACAETVEATRAYWAAQLGKLRQRPAPHTAAVATGGHPDYALR